MRAALFLTAALLASPAFAQNVNNSQHQTGAAVAETTVNVDHATDVGATAVASGNVITTVGNDSDTTLNDAQQMDGETTANADATVWDAAGNVAITSATVANGVTATSKNGDLTIDSHQRATNNASATTSFSGGTAANAGVSASSSANVMAIFAENGEVRLRNRQESTGGINANVDADHCCVGGAAVSGAVASANNLNVAGSTTTILSDTTQNTSGTVQARSDLYAGSAGDISGNATANGNAAAIDNQFGYVNARGRQQSSADVSAQSYVTLGSDFVGVGSAGAYGVGNQFNVANVASDTVMDTVQDNSGNVSAEAALAGDGGGVSLASSAAYGNTVSGSLCAYCDNGSPALTANNTQTNAGDVHARSSVTGLRAGAVGTTSTAIGNAATYQVTGPS